ncbi:MAG: hypothetical protein FWF38_06235 [Spirochaetaceae bacterium]|nr:hypothetical protein [Spirochaetaceae bacterium]
MESIQAVSSISVPFSQILKVSYSGGSLSVPVNDAAGINTRFKHITGVPLASEEGNISYYKLQQLDMLIDQISKLRNREMGIDVAKIEKDEIQDLINDFSYELRNRINSMPVNYYNSIYFPGSILNMTA